MRLQGPRAEDVQSSWEEGERGARGRFGWLLWVGAGVVVALPAVCGVVVFLSGWVPSNDWAVVVSRATDTFSAHPPLVGQWSSLSLYAGRTVHQPGPIQFWWLAVPEWLLAPSSVGALVGSALLTMVSLSVTLVAAFRRGGIWVMGATAVGSAVVLHGLGPWLIRDPYNPSAAVVALLPFLAACWSIMDGDRWFWPVAVFFGSMSAQTHVTYLVPLGAVGVAVVVDAAVRRRRSQDLPGFSWRGPGVVAGVVGLAVWAGPLIDQFWGAGNLGTLVRVGASRTEPVGWVYGFERLAQQLGFPPRFLGNALVLARPTPSVAAWVSATIVAVVLVAGLVSAWRGPDRTRAALASTVAASLVGATVSTARTPNEPLALASANNQLFWWPIAALTWLFIAWFVADQVRERVPGIEGRLRTPTVGGLWSATCTVIIVVLAASTISVSGASRDPVSITFGEVAAFSHVVAPACAEHRGPVAVTGDAVANLGSMSGVVAVARLHGCDVHTSNSSYFGEERAVTGRETLRFVISGHATAPPGYRFVARYDPWHPPPRYRSFRNGGYFVTPRVSYLYQRGG